MQKLYQCESMRLQHLSQPQRWRLWWDAWIQQTAASSHSLDLWSLMMRPRVISKVTENGVRSGDALWTVRVLPETGGHWSSGPSFRVSSMTQEQFTIVRKLSSTKQGIFYVRNTGRGVTHKMCVGEALSRRAKVKHACA